MKRHLTLLVIFPILAVSHLQAQPVDPATFDKNHDGLLMRKTELSDYFRKISELRTDEIDKDHSNSISMEEIGLAGKAFEEKVVERVDEFAKVLGGRQSYTIAEVRHYINPEHTWPAGPEVKKEDSEWTVHVRQDYEDLGILGKVDANSKAAGLAFSRTFGEGGKDTWDIDLAIILRRAISRQVYFLPSLSLDYSDNNGSDGKNEEDALIGRLAFEFVDPVAPGFTSFYRAGLATATETGFNSLQEVLELEWEPVLANSAIGFPKDIFNGRLTYHFRPIVHGEAGYVFDAGLKPALQELEQDFYSRIGGKLKLDLWSTAEGWEKWSANLSLAHYESLGPDAESGSLFEAALKYQLDDEGKWFLQLEYQNGQIPLLQDEVDKLTFGLGVKF